MNKGKNGFLRAADKVLPMYAWLPTVVFIVFQCIVFYATRIFNGNMNHYDLSVSLDGIIPFFSPAIAVYVLAYVQWLICFVVAARDSREMCFKVFSWDIVGKFISGCIFLIIPTTMLRPEISGNGFFDWLTSFIYSADSPDNLFPSLHCFESWICFRALTECGSVRKRYSVINLIFTLMVFASVVLVKQHIFADIFGGIAVAELGIQIAELIRIEKLYEKIDKVIFRKGVKD